MNSTRFLLAAASALALLPSAVRAGEASPGYGARLQLDGPGLTFQAAAFTPQWTGLEASGGYRAEKDGSRRFTMWKDKRDRKAPKIDGRATFRQEGDAVRATYELTPDRDIDLNQLYLSTTFALADYAGCTIKAGVKTCRMPEAGEGPAQFMGGRTTDFTVTDRDGKVRLALAFDRPVSFMMQNNHPWGSATASLRLMVGHDRPFKAGKTYTLSMTVSDGGRTTLAADAFGVKITAGADWIPMTSEPEIVPGSALDFTALRGTEAPAGKYGYPVAKGQNFEFEGKPGVAQRFYGVNICGDANTPDLETAEKFARRLAAIGYNALRFHHHESHLVQKDGVTLDPEKMRKFDGLVAACVRHGIYMTTDLFVSRRPVSYRSVGIDLDGNVQMDEFKELVQVHDGVFANYLAFARAFLGHVNPYTGRSLAQEPALGWISLVNEGNLGNHGMETMRKFPVFREKWQAWLAAKKAADPAFADVPDTLPAGLEVRKSPHVQAYALFLQHLETDFAARVTKFLREEMKCRALTTNMNCWHYPAVYQLPRANSYDYVDDHFYVDHPSFLENRWQLPSRCPNRNPMQGANMGAQGLAMRRVLDRPFTITEYNYSGPGRFRGVGGIACGTAAALQNWAGLWRFAWSHDQRGVKNPETKTLGYFDMSGDPLGLASERASICRFLRRDLEPLKRTYACVLPPKKLQEMGPSPMTHTGWTWASWYAKTGTVVGDAAPADATWSATYPDCFAKPSKEVRAQVLPDAAEGETPVAGDGAVQIDPKAGTFLLKTARTCGGFAEGGRIEADALTADLGKTAATLWASSLDGKPVRASDRLLVTYLTDVQNSDIEYADRALTILLKWGHLPHLMRKGRAEVNLAVPAGDWRVHVLASNGARRRTVPCTYANGRLTFVADNAADPSNASYLYEVVKDNSAANAAPADELARAKKQEAFVAPDAPEGYRRPKDWKPVLYPKGLQQIAKDHSAETMARAKTQMEKVNAVNAAGKYKATGASMDAHPCPDWFVDAKLGIFVDWGPWSVASWCPYVKGTRLYPDWYEFRCRTDAKTMQYHEKNWGADFKSDHFFDLFRGARFDAPALMKLFRACGAKYVVPFLKHHGGFCLWDCSYTFRDTVDQGAHRDFAKEMADACRANGLKFGLYTSQAGEWEYPILQDDGSIKIAINTPENLKPYTPDMEWKCSGKIAVKDFVHDYIVPQQTEFIDRYDPDLLWYDFDWMTPADSNGSYEITAYLYNRAEGRKEVACNDRYGKARPEEIKGRFTKRPRNWLRTVRGDFFTDEWGDTEECLDPAKWHPWESCSGISKSYGNHWMESYDPSMVMTEKEFIIHFSDIVARGGNLLLLVNLDPQGAILPFQKERLEQIGRWLETYGEAIYGTRICAPYKTDKVDYTQSKDGKTAYAIVKEPSAEVELACALPAGTAVTVVGADRKLAARRTEKGTTVVSLPADLASAKIPFALRCTR